MNDHVDDRGVEETHNGQLESQTDIQLGFGALLLRDGEESDNHGHNRVDYTDQDGSSIRVGHSRGLVSVGRIGSLLFSFGWRHSLILLDLSLGLFLLPVLKSKDGTKRGGDEGKSSDVTLELEAPAMPWTNVHVLPTDVSGFRCSFEFPEILIVKAAAATHLKKIPKPVALRSGDNSMHICLRLANNENVTGELVTSFLGIFTTAGFFLKQINSRLSFLVLSVHFIVVKRFLALAEATILSRELVICFPVTGLDALVVLILVIGTIFQEFIENALFSGSLLVQSRGSKELIDVERGSDVLKISHAELRNVLLDFVHHTIVGKVFEFHVGSPDAEVRLGVDIAIKFNRHFQKTSPHSDEGNKSNHHGDEEESSEPGDVLLAVIGVEVPDTNGCSRVVKEDSCGIETKRTVGVNLIDSILDVIVSRVPKQLHWKEIDESQDDKDVTDLLLEFKKEREARCTHIS